LRSWIPNQSAENLRTESAALRIREGKGNRYSVNLRLRESKTNGG